MPVSDTQLQTMLATQTAQSAAVRASPSLPSAGSALAFVRGEPGALPVVMLHTAVRAGIIGAGLYVAGTRRNLFRTAIVSSLAIETFVLCWAVHQNNLARLNP
jgi:hypothetical protein